MNYVRFPNDPDIPKKPRSPRNRTGRTNPRQLTLGKNFRGVLKRNRTRFQSAPNPPDFIGIIRLEDREYWVSGWTGPAKGAMSLILQDKEPPGSPGAEPYPYRPDDIDIDDVPF